LTPGATLKSAGVTEIDRIVALVTVRFAVSLIEFSVALIWLVPT